MDFFGIGMGEVLLILVIALVIFGPERAVEIGKSIGKMVRTLKRASTDLTTQFTAEVEKEELKKEGKSHLPEPGKKDGST